MATKKQVYKEGLHVIGEESQKSFELKALKGAPKLEETWDREFDATQTLL